MRKSRLVIMFLLLCLGCDKEVQEEDLFKNFLVTPAEVPADGQSLINVSVNIDGAASADRRNFIFTTSAGTFAASGTNKMTVKAEYIDGLLKAKTVLKAPFSPGDFTVTVQPEFDSPVRDFIISHSAKATISEPGSLDLEPSSFGITANFASQVRLTALLKNKDGKNVSKGTQVLFEDELLDGSPAGGRFRNLQTSTADSSKVSAYYSAARYSVGTTIKIRSTVLNSEKIKTMLKDSVLITVNL